MKTILRVPTPNGDVDVNVEINESEFAKLAAASSARTATPTGYERAINYHSYYYVAGDDVANERIEKRDESDLALYNTANYYSSEVLANINARADRLMRQLRRFAVENREHGIDWNDQEEIKWYIAFFHHEHELCVYNALKCQSFGVIYFDSKEAAQAAVNAFHDELIWYFTEYKNSL